MKIIRPGNLDYKKQYRIFECYTCKCLFECDNTEYVAKSDMRNDRYYTAKCPTCQANVFSSKSIDDQRPPTYYSEFANQINSKEGWKR